MKEIIVAGRICLFVLYAFPISVGSHDTAMAQGVTDMSTIEKRMVSDMSKPDGTTAPALIGPGDLLDISVFGEPELAREVRVAADGTANIVMLGATHVGGMTAQEAGEAIGYALRLHNFLKTPQVNVLIKESPAHSVSILGEVQHPGAYQITGARTLLEVLSMAGGLTATADSRAAVKHKDGRIEIVSVPLRGNIDESVGISEDRPIFPGDLIVIARVGIVYILGEVNRPGGFVMQNSGHTTALQVLSQAGGGDKIASLDHSILLRKMQDGYSNTKIHLGQIAHGKEADLDLQPNDVIFVPNSKLKSAARGTQEIVSAVGTASIYAALQ